MLRLVPLIALPLIVLASPYAEPEGVYQYGFALEDRAPGFRIALKHYAADLDPALRPSLPAAAVLRLAAARGEWEPATFVLYATRQLPDLQIEVRGVPAEVEVRRVVRTPFRRIYQAKPADSQVIGRFLPLWEKVSIPAGEFREVWLSFRVSPSAAPGEHAGSIEVRSGLARHTIPLKLKVHRFELREHPWKSLGMYYPFESAESDEEITLELKDQLDHGVRNLVAHAARLRYIKDGAQMRADYSNLRRYLRLARDAGFRGSIVAATGFLDLARQLGHKDVDHGGTVDSPEGKSLDGPRGEEFRRVARATVEGLRAVQQDFPEIRLVLTEMDEVFGKNRLPLYMRLTVAAQQVPGFKFYITFNTAKEEFEDMRKRIDPYVDVRGYHGFALEWWIARGHTWEEMERELARSGDEAWFYHNVRGAYYAAQWARIINGVYLWATPMRVHAPWIYQRYYDNPFDDGDHRRPDFGMAFPDPGHPGKLVPTRIWECMREGYDDLRYLATLEHWANLKGGAEGKASRAYLDKVRALVRDVKPAPAGSDAQLPMAKPGEQADLDTGIVIGAGKIGSAEEAPIVNALARRFTAEQWQTIRNEIAVWIGRLAP